MTANPQTNSRLLDDTHTALAACDVDVTNVDKADHFVLATYATGDSPHGNDNADWKLEWRRIGGTFADVSATSEINWGAGTDVTPNVTDEQNTVETDAGCLTETNDSFNAGNNALNAPMDAPNGIGQMQWVLGFGAGALDNQEYEFQITNTTDTVSAICAATIKTSVGVTTELITKTSNLRIGILDQLITKTSNLRVKALGQSITKTSNLDIRIPDQLIQKTSNLRVGILDQLIQKTSNLAIKVSDQLITKTSNLRIFLLQSITKTSNLRILGTELVTKSSNLAIKVFGQSITKNSNLRIFLLGLITKTSNLAVKVFDLEITKTSNLRINTEELITKTSNLAIKTLGELLTKTSNLRILSTELITKTSNLAIAVDGLLITKISNLRIVIVGLLTKTSNLRILGTELVQKSSNLAIKVFDQLITKTSNLRIVIVGTIQKTSNLAIKVFGLSITKPSNLRIKLFDQLITKTSNLRIFILQIIQKTSNLRIGIADQLITKTSNLRIFILQTIQKSSNLRIFAEQLITKTSNLDIRVPDNLIQKTSNLSIVVGGLQTIQKTSNLRVKATQLITKSSNVRVVVPALFTISVDDSDVGIVRKLMAQAGRQTIVSHVNDCLPVYASGSSDHTIYTDFQDIVDVAGIWLTDDIYHSGTNYLQGSIISPKDGVIEVGLNLPLGTEEILITYAHKDGLDDETIQLNIDMAKNYLQMELWKQTLNFSGSSNYETMAKWTMYSVATYYSLLTMNMSNAIQSGFNYRIAEFEIQTKLWGEGMIAETLLKSYWDRSMQMTKALKIFESNPDAPVYVVNRKNSRTPYNKDPTVFNTMMSSIAVSTLYDSRSEIAFIIKILG